MGGNSNVKNVGRMHRLFGTAPNDGGMQPKEALAFSVCGFGQNLICALIGSFISYYFINGLLMAPAIAGIIMLVVRVFDAFNDPIMGTIVDRTRTKNGKCRPYLKWMPIPIAIFTVLVFLPLPTDPTLSAAIGTALSPQAIFTVGIATSIYVVWSVLYTIIDVPYWGLATSMTDDTVKRGKMLTVARLFCTVGAGIITILIPLISNAWISDYLDSDGSIIAGQEFAASDALRQNYWWLALILVLIALPTFFIGYKYTKERYYSDSTPPTLKQNLGYLFKNKPLLLIVASGVLGSARTLFMYSGIFFAAYNLSAALPDGFMGMAGIQLFTLITIAVVPGGLVASLLVPWCTAKFGKRNTFIVSHIFGAVVMFIMFAIGWKENWALIVNLILLILAGIPQGFANIMSYAMIGDSVEYLELKTGERGEGICFAMQTFINKMGMAIGAAVSCFGLAWAGIDASDKSTSTLAGNAEGLDILFLISVLIPAISMLLCVIPLFFYKFNEKEQIETVKAIAIRKYKVDRMLSVIKDALNSELIVSSNDIIISALKTEREYEDVIAEFYSTSKDSILEFTDGIEYDDEYQELCRLAEEKTARELSEISDDSQETEVVESNEESDNTDESEEDDKK